MSIINDKLIKSWYWKVQPAKFVYSKFKKTEGPLYCFRGCTADPVTYSKDNNGNKYNQHATFKCSSCKKKIKVALFYSQVLKLDPTGLPASTNYFELIGELESIESADKFSKPSDRTISPAGILGNPSSNKSCTSLDLNRLFASTSAAREIRISPIKTPNPSINFDISKKIRRFDNDREINLDSPSNQVEGQISGASHKRKAIDSEPLPYDIDLIINKKLKKHSMTTKN
ncbi:hypothetical protein AYI70_g6976 [Smittium culicis]|uniref:Uncharacterized protein n=1 Tax=Smittium culicis TaxID=133412 RepID=A0A1R1XMK7_9FUNG|nr:hypothetical protein AYI70_g6976 [Smittium culicis]